MRSSDKDAGASRIIRGTVFDVGGAYPGVGFTATRTAVGSYTIRLWRPFKMIPSVLVTPAVGGATLTGRTTSVTRDTIIVSIVSAANAATDATFAFEAIGED